MEDSYKRVTEMLFYPTADIRRAAAVASSQLCRAVWRIHTGSWQHQYQPVVVFAFLSMCLVVRVV